MWTNAPKTFLQDSNVAIMGSITGDMFLLGMFSGGNAQVFAATPGHAKRIAQIIAWNVSEYERKAGKKIDVPDWAPGIVSPIQIPNSGESDGQGKKNPDKRG